ncbi:DUF4145 domain-containing protein [Shewanella vesiculosa]|jgi:hypothetical protein|uniref:DUF4145 domain-containing protein n=1 Tax=Shewanella vesiculosa TaxID=518738 RepID=UPI003D0589E7
MDNFVEILNALAWPATVIWLGYMFRAELRLLLGRLTRVKHGSTEFGFGEGLKEAEVLAQKTPIDHVPPKRDIDHEEILLRIAEVSPRAAVVEAWTLIENAAVKKGLVKGTVMPKVFIKDILEHLQQSGKFSPQSIDLILKLKQMRNHATHMPDFAITQDEAERYLRLAAKSAEVIMLS